jgi:hypothetical protein
MTLVTELGTWVQAAPMPIALLRELGRLALA